MTITSPDPAAFPALLARAEFASIDEDWPLAARRWQAVTAANPVNGAFWLKLAEACRKSGDDRGTIAAEGEAFRLGGEGNYASASAYRIATAHARLGEHDAAMAWLERAFDGGYHDLAGAREDDDLAPLRDKPRFRELVGLIDRDTFDRDDGWRYDVRFAASEILRRAYAPYGVISAEAFAERVADIEAAVPDLSDHQVIVELLKLVRLLNDGHARVRPAEKRRDLRVTAPYECFLFEEGLFITATAPTHRDLLGAEIQAIGGHAIPEVLETFGPIMVRDNENDQWMKACVVDYLRQGSLLQAVGLIPDAASIPLTVLDLEGKIRDVSVSTCEDDLAGDEWIRLEDTLASPAPLYLRNRDMPFWFTHLPEEGTVYAQFSQVRDVPTETLDALAARLVGFVEQSGGTRFVLDMRWNGGGNTLQEWPMLRRLVASPQINRRGAFFVIIGRHTFSAAQNGVNFFSVHSEAIFVGEPTGSSPCFIGETHYFELPYSRTVMNVADLHWVGTWPGDKRIWLPPTLYSPPTFAAYRENRDPALEAILAWTDHLPGR